jgi:predicted RND superfamily exporter protein
MQSDLSKFLPSDDPTIQLWARIYKEFPIGATIIVYIDQTHKSYDIRDFRVLTEMDEIIRAVDPYPDGRDGVSSVQSISNYIKEENAKQWIPGGLGGTGRNEIPTPYNAGNYEELIARYMTRLKTEETKGVLYTNDYKVAVIVIQLASGANYYDILDKTKLAIENRGTSYSDMFVTGTFAVQKAMQERTFQALKIVFPLAIVLVVIVLLFFHRTIKGLVIGLLPLAYALVLTFGILGVVQPELSMLSIAVVALLVGLGVDYSIYLANRFVEEYTIQDKIERVERTIGRTGKAVLMCAVTTIIGFGSLMSSYMPPMAIFGFSCVIGISFALISSTILVPCLALILKFEKPEVNHRWKRFANIIVEYRKKLFAAACFLVILSLILIPNIRTDVNYYDMAPKGIPEIEKLLEYSERFGGGTSFNALLVETDTQGLTYPEVIDAIYNMQVEIRKIGVSVTSIADEIKKVNEVLDRNQITKKLGSMFGVSKIIYDRVAETGLINKDYSKTIIVVSLPAGKSVQELEALVNKINSIVENTHIPHNGQISQLVGQDVVTVKVNKQIMSSQTQSLITSFLLVLASLIIQFNSSKIGVISLAPVLFVLACQPGVLVTLDIPLSVINVSIASIMIGTTIDYSIQVTQRVREEIARGISKIEAVKTTIETSGWSIVGAATTTSIALTSTFIANIQSVNQFTIVVISLIVFSFVATMFVLPTLLTSKLID